MSGRRSSKRSSVGRTFRKLLVSGFVLTTYAAYALHERFGTPAPDVASVIPPTPDTTQGQGDPAAAQAAPQASPTAQAAPTVPASQAAPIQGPFQDPTAQGATVAQAAPSATTAPLPTSTSSNGASAYKNGTYTGAKADAFYGTVQVRVVIKNGSISAVQFLDYPQDRRTSQRINSVATPWLQTEAIQAQSANVDIISGATLTSEAFMVSLQSALDAAHN
jgi:uncharacterized protein with FMN-binding domain